LRRAFCGSAHFFRQALPNPTSIRVMREIRCRRAWALAFGVVAAGAALGCQPAEVKDCRDRYLVTHAQVAAVDPQDLTSVEAALGAVQSNLEVCERANLAEESKQLDTAKRKLESHQSYLRARGAQKVLTPEQLDALEKDGDPECPKGQAYQYQKSGKRIRCTGPQIISMNAVQAKAYFGGRGFKVSDTDKGLKAEMGSESYTFEYAKEDDAPAQCIVVFSQPGIAWQETIARLTGAMPSRLKEGTPVRVGKLEVPFTLQADPVQAILRFGACAAGGPPGTSSGSVPGEVGKPGENQ
jgi:hypothetical protein